MARRPAAAGYPLIMRTIPFARSPVFVSIGEAFPLAGRYWRATWDRWLLAVLAVALVTGLAEWLLGGAAIDQATMSRALLPGSAGRIDSSELPRLLAGPLAVGVVSLVASWFLAANAVAGVRGREVTLPWVLAAGLRAFVATMIVSLVVVGILLLVVGLGLAGLLVMLAAFPGLLYLSIRLQFWTLAIFDGSPIEAGARTSWALTRNAVMRALGWGLALFGLGAMVGIVDLAVGLVLAGAPLVANVTSAVMNTTLGAFSIVMMAILYESQRLRNQPPQRLVPPPVYDPEGKCPPPPPTPPADPWQG